MDLTSGLRPKVLFTIIFSLFIRLSPLTAVDIDRTELTVETNTSIFFYNYEGPHDKIDSREAIRQIGAGLGAAIRQGALQTGSLHRYAAYRLIADSPAYGLNSDLIVLGVDVGVDHIKNLRLIIQGYLQAAFNYSEADAQLLATIITIYNAVYRGSYDFITERYNQIVVNRLEPAKFGLSVRWDDWPGKTQILLPLISLRLSSFSPIIDPSPLSEPAIIEELRMETDQGVEIRQALVEVKERQADDIRQSVQLEREAIIQAEAELAAQKAALSNQVPADSPTSPTAISESKVEERPAAVAAVAESQPSTAATVVESQPARVAAKTETITPPKTEPTTPSPAIQEIAAKEAELKDRLAAVEEAEAVADRLEREAAQDREVIAADQQRLIDESAEKTIIEPTESYFSVIFTDPTSSLSSLVRLSPQDKPIVAKSLLATIRSRSWLVDAEAVIAIAGLAEGQGAVRLVKLDPLSLEMLKQGDDDIRNDSPIWTWQDRRFVLCELAGETRLMEFDTDLKQIALSSLAVHPYMVPTFIDDWIIVQSADGQPKLLNSLGLSEQR